MNYKICLSISSFVLGAFCIERCLPKIPLKKYTEICLRFAVVDDEICRNELENNFINGKKVEFPSRDKSISYRYKLFLEMYKGFTLRELVEEKRKYSERLYISRKYLNEQKVDLDIEII